MFDYKCSKCKGIYHLDKPLKKCPNGCGGTLEVYSVPILERSHTRRRLSIESTRKALASKEIAEGDLNKDVHQKLIALSKLPPVKGPKEKKGKEEPDDADPEEQKELKAIEATQAEDTKSQVALLKRLNDLATTMKDACDAKWKITSRQVADLTEGEVLRFAETGLWSVLSKDTKPVLKKSAQDDFEDKADAFATDARQDGFAAAKKADPIETVKRLLEVRLPGLTTQEVKLFLNEMTKHLPGLITKCVTSVVPFMATISSAFDAACDAGNVGQSEALRRNARDLLGFLRPNTPEMACRALVELLAYHRNVFAVSAATNLAQAAASLFDLGVGSGVAGSFAHLAICVHRIYHGWSEMRDYNATVASDPYKALRGSGTAGAYVILNYPAIGLVNPKVLTMADLQKAEKRRFFRWYKVLTDSRAEANIKTIRQAADFAYDNSTLMLDA